MKIAFTGTYDIYDVHKRSGTPFYMAKNLEKSGIQIDFIGPLKTHTSPAFKIKRALKKWTGGSHDSSRWNEYAARDYAKQIHSKLSPDTQVVMTHILNTVAYLDCNKPLVLWTDALYASLVGCYSGFENHSAQTLKEAHHMTREFFSRCSLAIFSSEWAARGALEIYGVSKEKIKVVPFGANTDSTHSFTDIKNILKQRSRETIKLLFLGKEWLRKGGDTVLAVAKTLHSAGHSVALTIAGCHPPPNEIIPPYVKCVGYLSKKTPEGLAQIHQLLRESHFLFMPSRTEAYGLVFCEASAFGLPSLTTYVGGIPIKDNVNGMRFSLEATPAEYCNYIVDLMQNYSRYEELALSSFDEYETRLNWTVACRQVREFLKEIQVSPRK